MSRLSQSIAMGVGTSGAMTDVSSYVDLATGVSRRWGRDTEFEDAAPGTFSFVLDNSDGRFTPGNTASALATTVTEGMPVCWKIDNGSQSRLVAGVVRGIEPAFPSGQSAWAQVRITCDDMLGDAGRRNLLGLDESVFEASGPLLRWPLDETSSETYLLESFVGSASFTIPTANMYPGSTASHLPSDRVVRVDSAGSASAFAYPSTVIDYGTTTLGSWGVWLERDSTTAEIAVAWTNNFTNLSFNTCNIRTFGGALTMRPGVGTRVIGPTMENDTPYYCAVSSSTTFAVGVWTITYEFFVNGVSYGTSVYDGTGIGGAVTSLGTADRQLRNAAITNVGLGGTSGSAYVSELTHSRNTMNLYLNRESTADVRLRAIANIVPEITLDTLPTMSSTVLAVNDTSGQSALDAFNDVIRTEQGHIYTATTGTLTSPIQKVKVKSRDRSETVAYTFDIETEAQGTPQLVRDITNLVSSAAANGPETRATYIDSTLTARAGSANSIETVLARDYADLLTWAQDRLNRGANTRLRVVDFTVDAMVTPTDRSADLMALVPGDRIRISGLPSSILGFTTWDGWFLGASETHTIKEHSFTLYLQPVLPDTAVYDSNYWMADGALTLSSAIASAGATSMSVATSGPMLETSAVPYNLLIDNELVTVTACTGATPQVATITRGVGGTTATTHTTSAVIEVPDPSLYAF